MRSESIVAAAQSGLTREEIRAALVRSMGDISGLKRVLLLPPDFTRYYSNAGEIVQLLWEMLTPTCQVDIMPALGSHVPVSEAEWKKMYGEIPYEKMLVHNWRTEVVKIGEIPGSLMEELSEGVMHDSVDVEINHRVVGGEYDLILSIGQVVPHEVVGMANRNKNLFVGCGGSRMINASHMLGAFYGMDRIIGRDRTPVREMFDYAEENFLKDVPLSYILTVTTAPEGEICTHGLFIGRERARFEDAVALAQKINMIHLDRPIRKAVVWMDPVEFKATWVCNKAIYRTRLALEEGGELMILAPGVERFGEDPTLDMLIRRYGYCGRKKVLELVKDHEDLQQNLSAAAHIIHSSSEDRFKITYCVEAIPCEEIESVYYGSMPFAEAVSRYNPEKLQDGWNTMPDGEEIYFISNPALGLWTVD